MRRAKGVGCVDDVIPVGFIGQWGLFVKRHSEVIILAVFVKLEKAVSSSTQEPRRAFRAWPEIKESRAQMMTYIDIKGYHNGAYHNGRDRKQEERHFEEIKKLEHE